MHKHFNNFNVTYQLGWNKQLFHIRSAVCPSPRLKFGHIVYSVLGANNTCDQSFWSALREYNCQNYQNLKNEEMPLISAKFSICMYFLNFKYGMLYLTYL